MKKIAVYTCITDGYDYLSTPSAIDSRLDYYIFTDAKEVAPAPWRNMKVNLPHLNAKDQNRYIKMHAHEYFPDYDMTIYLDGSIKIVGDLFPLISRTEMLPELVFAYSHPQRNCLYAEAAACAYFAHDWIWTISSQMRRYDAAKYPSNNGLYEAGVLILKRSKNVSLMMEAWWSEYLCGAKRDQLALPFVAWKLKIPIGALGESDPRFGNVHFKFISHIRRRNLKLIVRKYVNRIIAFMFSYDSLFFIKSTKSYG